MLLDWHAERAIEVVVVHVAEVGAEEYLNLQIQMLSSDHHLQLQGL